MKSRRAFTIVELMVAVSILAILVTLAVVGFRSINRAGKNRDTATRLQAAKTMLDEFIRVNRGRVTIPTGTLDAPGNVEKGSADRTGKQYSLTRAMMGQIMRIPENKAAVSGLPADALETWGLSNDDINALDAWASGTNYDLADRVRHNYDEMTPTGSTNNVRKAFVCTADHSSTAGTAPPLTTRWLEERADQPVILDAWGNPVLFVPQGLEIPSSGDPAWASGTDYSLRATVEHGGRYYTCIRAHTANTGLNEPGSGSNWQEYWVRGNVASPDLRPFFASAGEDGDFRTRDDNVYSFEN